MSRDRDWYNDLKSRYPGMFDPCFDFSVGIGWKDIIEGLCANIRAIDPTATVAQVKEKFGGLRFYMESNEKEYERIHRLIGYAEVAAAHTCEFCGKPGTEDKVNRGWIKTLCPECIEARSKGEHR